jgi:hypothetical protein
VSPNNSAFGLAKEFARILVGDKRPDFKTTDVRPACVRLDRIDSMYRKNYLAKEQRTDADDDAFSGPFGNRITRSEIRKRQRKKNDGLTDCVFEWLKMSVRRKLVDVMVFLFRRRRKIM